MPIPQVVRIDPRDLDKNKAIGVSIPFNGGGVFKSTFSTKDQIKSNLVNLLLTDVGERVMNPTFGCNLRRFLFEGITENNIDNLKENLNNSIAVFVPEISVTDITVVSNNDFNTIDSTVNYFLIISSTPDQVTVQFN